MDAEPAGIETALTNAFRDAQDMGLDLVTDNAVYLLMIPAAFLGLRIVKRLVRSVG